MVVCEEDVLSAVASLRDMIGNVRDNGSCYSWHVVMISNYVIIVYMRDKKGLCPLFSPFLHYRQSSDWC